MSSKQSCWEVYKQQMSEHNYGDALWHPTPLSYFKRIQPGDVGCIRRGRFHLLFPAGRLEERQSGTGVPRTFKPLDVGPITGSQRSPGHLLSSNIEEIEARYPPSASTIPSSISFQLAEDQGAVLMTKYPTYQEDVELIGNFEKYTKDHYDSWVAFARKAGHGDDVKPILVTGVDMTRDFAMMTCQNNGEQRTFRFTTSAPGVGSVWGTWHSKVPIYTNSGPRPSRTSSLTQTMDPPPPSIPHTDTTPDEYDQCVFIRYYTVRKRLGIPRVVKAAAGPHDLGPGGYDEVSSLLEELSDPGPDSDTASSLFDDDDQRGSSATSSDPEDDTPVHNTTHDGRDDFDVIADYIFQNSSADSALIHHRDIALLRESGSGRDLYAQLVEKCPRITVDENGVGKIEDKENPPANLQSHRSLDDTRVPIGLFTGRDRRPPQAPTREQPVLQPWRHLASQSSVSSDLRQIVTPVDNPENRDGVLKFGGKDAAVVVNPLHQILKEDRVPLVWIQGESQRLKSLADIAHNWRDRSNENRIRVTSSRESQYTDDEATDHTKPDVNPPALVRDDGVPIFSDRKQFSGSVLASVPALPQSALLPIQRRSRALSYVEPPQSTLRVGYPVPYEPRTPNRGTLATLRTPPPNASIINKLKVKGSTTEHPAPRRRFMAQPITSELCNIDEDECAPYPAFGVEDIIPPQVVEPEVPSCSICGIRANVLAILEPCDHPLCSACFTSALNIVGEKDMQCAVCNTSVQNFHPKSFITKDVTPRPAKSDITDGLLPSAFDINPFLVPPTNLAIPRSSTPVEFTSSTVRTKDSVVLRIDNVPRDITPPMIVNWLKQPVVRAHVLLDRKGKALSHVFVEMANEDAAKVALRTTQNSVLGQGKRARGVTVTRSSQMELMKSLFPSWQGKFDGSRPSLAGIPDETVVATLQAGLMTEGELSALLHLIRSPDVPCLPFYSLISILFKFPSDLDSRVFWSSALRDFLYDITYAAVQILVSSETSNGSFGQPDLLLDLLEAGINCQAFTEFQIGRLSDLVSTNPDRSVASSVNTSNCDLRSSPATPSSSNRRSGGGSSVPVKRHVSHGTSSSYSHTPAITTFDDIAEEFGVRPDVVEALARRLSGLY